MFVKYVKNENRVPIKIWLPSIEYVEESCLEQANNLSNLPFVFKHVALIIYILSNLQGGIFK